MILYAPVETIVSKKFKERIKTMKKFVLALLMLPLFSVPAGAASVQHDFTVFLGPFDASRTTFTYSLAPGSYEVKSSVRTAGLFDTLYPFKADYFTSGKIKKEGLETSQYRYRSKTRFNRRSKELVYNEKGIPVYRISTKNDKEKKVAIENSPDNKDTTDLQTVFAELAKQYNEVKFCDSRMQVFDGKRRFDVIFRDEGREELQPNQYSPAGGLAAKCSMYIDKLNSKDDDLLWELTSERPIYFWILEQDNHPFIARVMVEDTPLGRLDVYTSKVTVKE